MVEKRKTFPFLGILSVILRRGRTGVARTQSRLRGRYRPPTTLPSELPSAACLALGVGPKQKKPRGTGRPPGLRCYRPGPDTA